MMQKKLKLFRSLQINKEQLQQAIGDDLYNIECTSLPVKRNHVINAVKAMQEGNISLERFHFPISLRVK